ncbi:flavin-containing monooxygenase [Crocosphaera sp. Alani8]|uniref:flavin-containing monooxygenase n=1 Tax=Crocosphaera sp. Alani8 TaxID=3038952 RepID=UPI00313E4CA1
MLACIVIGAGPGGLVTTKELLEQGVNEVVCLEKTNSIGGVFANAYDNLRLTSSCTYSMFSDFWMGDGKQHDFWSKDEVLDYWKRYAQHFGVLDKICFHSEVISLTFQENQQWQVKLKSGEELLTKRVALAIGNNHIPNYPHWKNQLTQVDIFHSQEYRNGDPFIDKNVLVVGGGESASDVAFEVASVAKKCWVSLRNSAGWILPRKRGNYAADIATHRGLYGLPREYGNILSQLIIQRELSYNDPINNAVVELNKKVKAKNQVWGIYGTKTFALPKAIVQHGCGVVGEITEVKDDGKTLIAADGEVLENVDVVIFCTGYKNKVSFLPDELKQTDPRSLYKHMFAPQLQDKIVWIGWARPNYGSQFPIMEMQARFFALLCSGQKALPNLQQMEQQIAMDQELYLKEFEHSAERIRSLVDYSIYIDSLAALIGCQPPLWQYLFLHHRLWLRMVYGATQSTQFRLKGPGQKKELAHKLIMKLPVSSFNHVVKAGLIGRFIYALKTLLPSLPSLKKLHKIRKKINFKLLTVKY